MQPVVFPYLYEYMESLTKIPYCITERILNPMALFCSNYKKKDEEINSTITRIETDSTYKEQFKSLTSYWELFLP